MKIYFQCTECLYLYDLKIMIIIIIIIVLIIIRINMKKLCETAFNEGREEEIRDRNWQRKFFRLKWNDRTQLARLFCLAKGWKGAPPHAIAATKLCSSFKTRTPHGDDIKCRLCWEDPESLTRVLAALHWRKTGTL